MARTEIVEFKVDAEEKQRLRAFARERGEPLGTYVRKASLSFPEYGKTPISYETEHDRENKAKVRKAVENEESYEVKVEPGTTKPTTADVVAPVVDQAVERDSWIESMARIHMMEKPGLSKHAARAKATEEYEATQ